MYKDRLTDHTKQLYKIIYEEYIAALQKNVELPLATFCKEKEIDTRSFTAWMSNYQKITPHQIRNDVRKSLGMKELKPRGQLDYEKHLQAYRDMLAVDLDYTMTQYCTDVGISQHSFHHWIMRQGLNVEKIKHEVCASMGIDLNAEQSNKENIQAYRKPAEPRLFRKAIADYKKMLESDKNLSLQKFCRAKGYAYRPLLHWMREIGINPADIKSFVIDRQKLPKDNRRVFIQFKPNGDSSKDILNGVKISLPDGTQIDVESCTVIGLCSFVNIYSKQ